tara:strand:+ start:52 stop:639 length:588 start_codon:yes stop_codon:yes gene_type:complete
MIIWTKNQRLPRDLYREVTKTVKLNHKNKEKYYTSYFEGPRTNEQVTCFKSLMSFYDENIECMTKDLGLYHKSKYTYTMWMQMSNSNTDSHLMHTHFQGFEQISWVHFINVPNQKCFYFYNSREEKIYPSTQKTGDIIAFPPWALHGVDEVKQKNFDRVIVAGNLWFNKFWTNGKECTLHIGDDELTSYWKIINS